MTSETQDIARDRLIFVARTVAGLTPSEWKGLDQEKRMEHMRSARRAISADHKFAELKRSA